MEHSSSMGSVDFEAAIGAGLEVNVRLLFQKSRVSLERIKWLRCLSVSPCYPVED